MPSFLAVDGTRLHYLDEGDGPPLLCLAGLTRTSLDFDYVKPHLPPCRLIRMDYRGRGRSGWSGAESYTIPQEAQDALALLDHLGLERAPILGTSRGGIIAMVLAATAKDRLSGVCLNDIGPDLSTEGLDAIRDYIGRRPNAPNYEAAIAARASLMAGFENVPMSRWAEEVTLHYRQRPDGLDITYDPALRDAVLTASEALAPDLWPLFDALADLPIALIRGANSNLLTAKTADKMQARRPDLIRADVPGRGHVPFLDEPESITTIHDWWDTL